MFSDVLFIFLEACTQDFLAYHELSHDEDSSDKIIRLNVKVHFIDDMYT